MDPQPPSLAEGPLDRKELGQLRAIIGADGLSELIDLFEEDAPARLSDIAVALEQADIDGVRTAAHAYKGAAAGVGARRVAHLAHELERDARQGRMERGSALLATLRAETEVATTELRAFVHAP